MKTYFKGCGKAERVGTGYKHSNQRFINIGYIPREAQIEGMVTVLEC